MMSRLDRGFDLSNNIGDTFRYEIEKDNCKILKIQSLLQDGFVSSLKVINDP
jgi:hypothetical protein